MTDQGNNSQRASDTVNGLVGPSYCSLCGEWPARQTKTGMRCHLCMCRDICAEHPVPMPSDPQMRRDLESIGVIVDANTHAVRPAPAGTHQHLVGPDFDLQK